MEYMTNKWRKNFNGQITIFCSLEEEMEFSANFDIIMDDGIKKKGSIPPIVISPNEYEEGLKEIVEKIQEEVL